MSENLIKLLSPSDRHRFKACLGWIDLQEYVEALAEIDRMSPESAKLAEILDVRWQIFARKLDWESALEAARLFVKLHPEIASAWIHLSYSLHELGRTIEARDHLLRSREKFPYNALILYNLACYCCQLQMNDDSVQWIQEAIAVNEKSEILSMALEDKDLAPIRDRLSAMV